MLLRKKSTIGNSEISSTSEKVLSELLDNASTKEKALASRSLTLLREKMSRRAARQHFFEERCTGEPLDNAFTEEKVLSELPDSASTGEKASNLYNL